MWKTSGYVKDWFARTGIRAFLFPVKSHRLDRLYTLQKLIKAFVSRVWMYPPRSVIKKPNYVSVLTDVIRISKAVGSHQESRID